MPRKPPPPCTATTVATDSVGADIRHVCDRVEHPRSARHECGCGHTWQPAPVYDTVVDFATVEVTL
jgi:hypothetical protein